MRLITCVSGSSLMVLSVFIPEVFIWTARSGKCVLSFLQVVTKCYIKILGCVDGNRGNVTDEVL